MAKVGSGGPLAASQPSSTLQSEGPAQPTEITTPHSRQARHHGPSLPIHLSPGQVQSLPQGWAPGLVLLGGGLLLGQVQPAQAELLYRLETRCSLQGAATVPCTVDAIEEGGTTLYRHQIGGTSGTAPRVETVRILAKPVRMARWDQASKAYVSLTGAAARFSTNTVCFNGSDLCVVNPNYLNSVRQANSSATEGRDLVRVHFGADGRIDASCYDAGCSLVQP